MTTVRFLHPEIGWWIAAVFAICLAIRVWRPRRRFLASTAVDRLPRADYAPSFLRRLPSAIVALALLLIGGALMDPVLPYADAEVSSRGLDIVMLLDLSSSMQEPMERPAPQMFPSMTPVAQPPPPRSSGKTRLVATKDAIKTFVRRRREDRIALIVFSDNAYVVSPLTFDHEALLHYIDLVDDQILRGEGMTAIGDGLALANYLLARQANSAGRGNQVVVLFTDGENNKGRDPMDVLAESNAAKIRVHFIGVDLEQDVRSKPQVQLLLQAVRRFGGRYFNANTAADLDAASKTIDAIEKGSLVGRTRLHDAPVYHWFAFPALVCLGVAAVLRAVPFFIDRT